jgi:hypothetical protein
MISQLVCRRIYETLSGLCKLSRSTRIRVTDLPSGSNSEEAGFDTDAGGVLTSADKAQLVSVLGATPADNAKRASVVRTVAENSTLQQREFNNAFVLMQYFSYLQRNPDDPPDNDQSGYNFWLGKLNEFNGNFVNAEMVKAFISAGEYRTRFGQN